MSAGTELDDLSEVNCTSWISVWNFWLRAQRGTKMLTTMMTRMDGWWWGWWWGAVLTDSLESSPMPLPQPKCSPGVRSQVCSTHGEASWRLSCSRGLGKGFRPGCCVPATWLQGGANLVGVLFLLPKKCCSCMAWLITIYIYNGIKYSGNDVIREDIVGMLELSQG